MKIRESYRRLSLEKSLSLERHAAIKSVASSESPNFKDQLQTSQKKQLSGKLKTLLIEIDAQGKKLAKARTVIILSQYKELIKTFLKEIVDNLFLLKEENHFDPKGKHKVLIQVKSINSTLEELAKMVLDKEVDNLKLLEKTGQISGMLIDLYS